jgi:hypothetical protein
MANSEIFVDGLRSSTRRKGVQFQEMVAVEKKKPDRIDFAR